MKVREIKQLRPLAEEQPWGIFFINFEPRRLPVVVLRRILRALVPRQRASANVPDRAVWQLGDLLFISAQGEEGRRGVTFAHFREGPDGRPQLQTFSWDEREQHFQYLRELHLDRLRWPSDEGNAQTWREQWSSAFSVQHRETIRTSKLLATELASTARSTRELVHQVYQYEAASGALHRLHRAFRDVLVPDLDVTGFADMVAQTISYGLFSARATGEPILGLAHLEAMVPRTNPFLRELFAAFTELGATEGTGVDFDELGIANLVDLLNATDIEAVLRDFGRQTGGGKEDPVVHFYELFLNSYDKRQKIKRGVFYTPRPVVAFIVRSVDHLLRAQLDCLEGLGTSGGNHDNRVLILDPAAGTGTFLEAAIEAILQAQSSEVNMDEYVTEKVLPRLHGFELMMAPYAVAHMKLGLRLKEAGYEFSWGGRLNVFLTNAIEPPRGEDRQLRLIPEFLSREAEAADYVKGNVPITVVIGNPPYSGHSANRGEWITNLVYDYKKDVPGLDKPAQAKWLQDDYVKFIRLAEWYIERSGSGVLGFITNHAYLDNPTFRGMRKRLLETFSDIYIVDLHGSSKTKELSPDGTPDKNVFDIQQGVAIGIFVRRRDAEGGFAKVHHAELWGSRERKYDWLQDTQFSAIDWTDVTPAEPAYLFIPQDEVLREEYEAGWPLDEAMSLVGDPAIGVVTTHDQFAISWSRREMEEKITLFTSTRTEQKAREYWRLCSQAQWNYANAKKALRGGQWKADLKPILYRPFDVRWTVFNRHVAVHRRERVMKHMLDGDNLALLVTRSVELGRGFEHALVTSQLATHHAMSLKEVNFLLPLYLTHDPDDSQGQLLGGTSARRVNYAPDFIAAVSKNVGLTWKGPGKGDLSKTFGAEDLFSYTYAILNSGSYKDRFGVLLRGGFPRIPITSDRALFKDLATLGNRLVELHLDAEGGNFPGGPSLVAKGPQVVELGKFEDDRVLINQSSWIEPVSKEAWDYSIGGYFVMQQWLKDRRSMRLSTPELKRLSGLAAVVEETLSIRGAIDETIIGAGGWPLR